MNITKALLADYANITREGKLNVLGIFQTIGALSFPVAHPQMQLIFMWSADPTEANRERQLEIQLCDSDGKKILGLSGSFKVPPGTPGRIVEGNEILNLNNLVFEKSGTYEFKILIDNDFKVNASFDVIHVTPPVQGVV